MPRRTRIRLETDFRYFFDRTVVERAVDRKTRRILGRTGAFGRKVIRNNIRRRKHVSAPGRYPHAHVPGNDGMKLIQFHLDLDREEVIIGPIKFRKRIGSKLKQSVERVSSQKTVPQLLNEGGYASITTQYLNSGRSYTQRARYAARPFRKLALPVIKEFFRKMMAEIPL